MFRAENITRPGLAPASFHIARGRCLALMGPSGAGKTLLLRALVDLDPNDGRVWLDDRERRTMPAPEWRRRVSYVPADSGWWSERVEDHFTAPPSPDRLTAVGLPADALGWSVARLSTGERQRLALLRALELEPRVLLLDEPTSGLDAASRTKVEAVLAALLGDGLAILLVTHDKAQARRLASSLRTIAGGRLAPARASGQ